MEKKELRKWLREHEEIVAKVDALRKELEEKDLLTLLAMVEATDVLVESLKALVIAEILKSMSLVDQTKKG